MKLIIQLTPEQQQSIYEQIIGHRKGIQMTIPEVNSNPYKGLRANTIEFLKCLQEKYGTSWINRNDSFVDDLAYKLRISDIAQILKHFPECEIVKKENSKRIEKFRFTN